MANMTPDFAQFPFDYAVQTALKNQGFHSIYDILDVEETRFRQQYDIELNGYAGAIYQQAKNYLGMANNALRQQKVPVDPLSGNAASPPVADSYYNRIASPKNHSAQLARYTPPLYNQLFSDEHSRFVEPGSLQSLDSPVSYLVYLLSQLKKLGHAGTNAFESLLKRRPDLGTLLLNDDAFTRSLPTSELVWEILSDAFVAVNQANINRVAEIDRHLARDAVYPLTLPFDVAQTRMTLALDEAGLSFGDVFSMLAADYRTYGKKTAAALAWSGVSYGLHQELIQSATPNSQPIILQFDESGKVANGESLMLQLATLWPGIKVSAIQIADTPVNCKNITSPNKPQVTFQLSFHSAPQNATGVSVTAARTSAQTCEAGAIYRENCSLTVNAANQPPRQLKIGVLIGDRVGTVGANQEMFTAEAAQLEEYFGPDVRSAVAARMSVPVEMLCQAAGLTERQLQEAFALGDFAPQVVSSHLTWRAGIPVSSGQYGACYLWGKAAGLEEALPGAIQAEEIKTTVYQLFRLQKLIRLQHLTQLPYAALDTLIQAALRAESKEGEDLSSKTVQALGVYARYQLAYKLDAEQATALWGDINPYAKQGQIPLLDRVLAPAGYQPDFKLPLIGSGQLEDNDIRLLSQAFGVPAATLTALVNTHSIKKTLSGVSSLYRLVLLAERFHLSVDDFVALIALVCGPNAINLLITPNIDEANCDTLDVLMTLDEVVRWASQEQLPLVDMLAGVSDAETTARDLALGAALKEWFTKVNTSSRANIITKMLQEFTQLKDKEKASESDMGKLLTIRNQLAALARVIGQYTHLDPNTARALMVFHQALLDKALVAATSSPVSLAPLFLSAGLIQHYKLDEVALTPLLTGHSGMTPSDNLWTSLLALSDFARLALGDERVRPVLLSELGFDDQKKRLAQVYALDLNAVTQLIGSKTNLNVTTGAQLQRLVAFGRSSGWSLNDLQTLLEKGPLIEEWKVQQPLSQRCGPRKELARKALNTKLGEFRNKALLSLYKTTCRRSFIESEHKTWGAAFGEHEPNTTDVAGQLLMDPEMSAAVPTSRVAEAIASVQAFIQRIADGRESEWQLTAGELQRWRNNDSRYALWAANMQLRWHPDQYINPTTRQNKTLAFRQFENSLSQARLDQDSIEVALTEYLHNFEQVVNLETLGAYQDGMNSSQSPIYFLGRSPNAPFAYYSRRWGIDSSGLRRWSAWEKIDLPTSSNVMTRGDQTNPGWANYQTKHINDKKEYLPVQARLVVLTGRLYFIWVEARVVTPEQMVPDSANSGGKSTVPEHKDSVKSKGDGTFPEHQATKKRYRHVISLVHRRLDGGWSTPIELYQGKPADYLDPAPNLVAFAIPQYAADLKDITYAEKGTDSDGNPTGKRALLFKQAPTISGDLLLVSLNVVATDPEQKNAGSQYWLFDSFLDEIRTSPRKDKDSAQRQSNGLDLAKCDQTHPVVKTINELVKRSYFYVKPDACSSQVITPCIPDHWLFNERQWISRGEAVFGNKVSLTLTVKDAGQANRDSYETLSTVELTPQQWAAIPAGSRLVHFLSLQGRAKYQQITQEISRVSLVTRYPSGPLSAKEVYHGVMLIPNGSSTVVAIDNVDNALIEQGKLAVAHNFVEALGAEIKESAQGVQYLVTQYLEGQDIEQDAHSLHGTPQPTDGRQTVAMKGMACKLFVNLNAVTDITPAMLQAQDDWMSADFIPAPNGTRLSLWAYDVPAEQNKRKQVWLVTRVTGSSQLVALKKLTLPENVTAYQIAGNKLNKITLSTLKENDPPVAYLLTTINVPESSEKTYYQNCSLPLADMTAFGPMSFTFLLTHREQSNGKDIAPAGVALKVISERELQEDLKLNAGQTVFTSEDWGWTAPVFSTTTLPYTLNRTYRLPSAECQYFVVKVKVDQIAITKMADKHFVGFSISVQSPLSLPAYVIGLKNNTQTQCAIDGKSIAQRDNTLSVVGASELAVHTFLAQYDTLFFALPWTANAFADVRKDGLRFQLGNLKNQATIPGYIPCEVPSLSTAIITSSCSPTQVNVGDVVHITASIDLGAAHFSDGAHIEIALNNAYELLVSGISTPAGTQVGSNQLRLQLTAGQREASFSLPVRVRDTIANLLPLATLTVSDKRSVERVLLAQPAIGSGLNSQLAVQWHWQYGTDPQHLLTSATDRPITALALDQKYLLTALTLHPQAGSTDDRYTVKFTLPKGIEVENAAAKLTALDNIAALKKSIALLEPTWKTTTPDGTGNALVTLLSNKPLTEATLLVLPLKLTNKKGFIGAIKVEVIRGDDAANCWTAQSYPFWQPKKIKDVLTISAGCQPGSVAEGYRFGERFNVFLLIQGLASQGSQLSHAELHLPPQFSYDNGQISYSAVLTSQEETPKKETHNGELHPREYNSITGTLNIPLDLKLTLGEQYIVVVPVVAIPDEKRKPGATTCTFTLYTADNGSQISPDINPGNVMVSGVDHDVIPMSNNGASRLPADSRLPVGATFNYRVVINMSEADLIKQYGTIPPIGAPGPQIRLTLPDTLALATTTSRKITTSLATLSQQQAKSFLVSGHSLRQSDHDVSNSKTKVTVQTLLMPNQGLIGELIVPVTVTKSGPVNPTLTISPVNSNLQQSPQWSSLAPVSYNPPKLVAYDTNALPVSDLHFAQPGMSGFTDPIPLAKPALLAGTTPKTGGDKRYVRLNSQFGQELVRIAQRDVNAVFLAATQDHPLPPLEGGDPEPLEQDAANLLYFWELFYHAPALIAYRLNAEGRYDEAQDWLHRLMDPFPTLENGKKKAIWRSRLLEADFSYVALDNAAGLADPDTLASVQPEFYRRAVFNAYVKNLMDKGDSHYRELSRDGFNSAHQCYLLVAHLLGTDFALARAPAWMPLPASQAVNEYTAAGRPGARFGLPRSQLHQSQVEKLQRRLFNLRNGLTLDGKPLDLPLYDPPTDPALLLAARTGGVQAMDKLQATSSAPIFRYNVLYARTSSAVEVLIQYGNNLLSLIDRQQELKYQSLLISQQKEMAAFVISLQKDTLRMSEESRQGLEAALESARQRLKDLNTWIAKDISDQESQALSLRRYAATMGERSAESRLVGAALDLAPNIFGFSDGGMHWGAIGQAISDGFVAKAEVDNGSAMQIETREMYRHRLNDWKVSQKQIDGEVQQLEAQLRADTIQQSNLQRQLAQYEAQSRQFDEQRSFMENRFTNVALYQWLTSQVSALYYQAYDAVASLCLMTQAAWRYEVADYKPTTNFFTNGGWNEAHRGLLAGETLRLGLLRMDQAYLSRAERMLEIRHTFSLKGQLAEQIKSTETLNQKWRALLQVKPGSSPLLTIPITVTEKMLAERYPSHYLRQLVAVSVTLPCIVGPYEEVCATLVQKTGRFATEATDDTYTEMSNPNTNAPYIIKKIHPASSVALSSGLDDTGAFVLNFGDEKFLPFEGNGVVGEWELQIQNPGGDMQQRMLKSLNDIIITFRYRAKDAGRKDYAEKVMSKIKPGKRA